MLPRFFRTTGTWQDARHVHPDQLPEGQELLAPADAALPGEPLVPDSPIIAAGDPLGQASSAAIRDELVSDGDPAELPALDWPVGRSKARTKPPASQHTPRSGQGQEPGRPIQRRKICYRRV